MVDILAVPSAPGYGVDILGNVFSRMKRGPGGDRFFGSWEPKVKSTTRTGYLAIGVMVGGRRFFRMVHRLVFEAFVGPIPEGFEINHLDGNKKNNALVNLEVVTPKENIQHAIRTGLLRNRGVESVLAKLTTKQAEEIRSAYMCGEKQREIAARFSVSQSTVWRTIHERTFI